MTQTDEPWFARKDWSAGNATDISRNGVVLIWIVALFWNAVVLGIFSVFNVNSQEDPRLLWGLFSAFFAVGALALLGAIYLTLVALKYGRSILELQTLPAVPGGALAGIVHIAKPIKFRDPIYLQLGQYRWTQQGKNSQEILEWADNCVLGKFQVDEKISQIPVYFKIPAGAQTCTTRALSGHDIRWRLTIKAKTAGLNYNSQFLIPVFKRNSSTSIDIPDQTQAHRSEPHETGQALDPHIHVSPLAGNGCQFEISGHARLDSAILMLFLGLCFAAVAFIALLLKIQLFYLIPLAIAAIFLLGGLYLLLLRVSLTASHQQLTVDKDLPFWHRQRQFRSGDISDFAVRMYSIKQNQPLYRIRATLPSGQATTLCGSIRQKEDADWMIEQIKKAMAAR